MKPTPFTTIAVVLLLLVIAAFPQDGQQKGMDRLQHKQVTEMMKDSALVSMLMDSIAANSHMRMLMMQKMMHHAKADSTGMMQMCKMMAGDKEMHAMMMKMTGPETMTNGGMMKHGKMQKK